MSNEGQDLNDLLDDIFLAEDNLNREGYEEGLAVGRAQGTREGYELGYAKGVQLGAELAEIYATVVAHQQQTHTEKVQRTLQQLRKTIDDFPRDNNPEVDIIGILENIRNQYKRVCVLTASKIGRLASNANETENATAAESTTKDLSF